MPPWWNPQVNSLRQEVNRARRKMIYTGLPEDRAAFKAARNVHVANIRKAKTDVRTKFAQEPLSGKRVWVKLTKWLIHGNQVKPIPTVLEKHNGTYTEGLVDTISLLMDDLIPCSPNDPPLPTPIGPVPPSDLRITREELKTIVWRQKNRAPGKDGITAKILRAVWPVVEDPLLQLLNGCLKDKIYPHLLEECQSCHHTET